MGVSRKSPAICHPDRFSWNKGNCRPCYVRKQREERTEEEKQAELRQRAEWVKANAERWEKISRKSYLKRKYNITPQEYDELLKRYNGTCWICRRPSKTRRLAVDHNHRTKQVRGLLCFRCNRGIAMFSEDPNILSNAARYIAELDEEWHGESYRGIDGLDREDLI